MADDAPEAAAIVELPAQRLVLALLLVELGEPFELHSRLQALTLEVILLDFSVRTFTPVVVASVIANVATQKILKGQRCTVQRVDGLKLYVLPEGAR